MQSKLKISLLLLLLSSVTLLPMAKAQQERVLTARVTATATVTDNLQLVTIRDVDLINPPVEGTQLLVSPQNSPYAGLFRISGIPFSPVRITYLVSESLQEANGNGGIVQASYQLSGFQSDNQLQSILYAATGEVDIRLGQDGLFFIWLGALLDLSNALPGDYFSEFIIELEYTS